MSKSAILSIEWASKTDKVVSVFVIPLIIHEEKIGFLERLHPFVSQVLYNIRIRVVSDIQTRAEGERLYICYNTAAHIVSSTLNYMGIFETQ